MRKNCFVVAIVLLVVTFVSVSCTPNCQEIHVQIADWQTRYEDYWVEFDSVEMVTEMVDTTVAYTVDKYYTKMNHMTNSSDDVVGKTCSHYITIRNNNKSYSNRFAIRIEGKEYDESNKTWKNMSKTTNSVMINPQNTYTFHISHADNWRNSSNGYDENNVELKILQSSNYVERTAKKIIHIRRKQIRRIDELKMKDTVINNCECDVDALKARNEAVCEVFEALKKQKLIHTD